MANITPAKRPVRFDDAPQQYDAGFFSRILEQLNSAFFRLTQVSSRGWTAGPNYNTLRTGLDRSTATTATLTDKLETLIQDLVNNGKLGG